MNPIVIIGLGNLLKSDEGVGIHVLRALAAGPLDLPGADLVDAGASGMSALHAMANRRKAIFVDCAFMGEEPGAVRRFTPSEVASRKELTGFSLHEGDLLEVIALSRRLGECPEQIVIFGIQPQHVGPGEKLSPALEQRLEKYAEMIRSEAAR
ncbi:MAG: hydrogenase maturation protease [Verrucomicrobiota bacterium]